jgi:uncharacterized membrane protein YgdD (TMEM256/DUF423 family)
VSDYQSTAFASQRLWGVVGSVFAALAIVIGAFGAHGLRDHLQSAATDPVARDATATPGERGSVVNEGELNKRMQWFETGAHYHLVHSIAIVLVGLLGRRGKARIIGFVAAGCFIGGILLFSGGLYALAVTGFKPLAHVVPFGGTLFIAGWILFAFAAGMPRTARNSGE